MTREEAIGVVMVQPVVMSYYGQLLYFREKKVSELRPAIKARVAAYEEARSLLGMVPMPPRKPLFIVEELA